MSRRIVCVVPCLIFCACLSTFGQGGRGGATQTTSPLPDNPQSLSHVDAAKKLANGDPVLMTPENFFCSPVDYNKPGPELEPMKVFDNLYAIPSSPIQQTTVWAIPTRFRVHPGGHCPPAPCSEQLIPLAIRTEA
jgi:hypothetical protein